MSYDVDIVRTQVVWSGNHTTNTSEIFEELLDVPLRELGQYDLDEVESRLRLALRKALDPDVQHKCRQYESVDGWGTFESTFRFLIELYLEVVKLIREQPGSSFRVEVSA